MAATGSGLEFPFTVEVGFSPLLGTSWAGLYSTVTATFLFVFWDIDIPHLEALQLLASCWLHITVMHSLCSQSGASRLSGKWAGVCNSGLILLNRIQVSSLSVPCPCGWHMKAHIEKEHFSSPNWPQAISVKWLSLYNKWSQHHSQY